MAIYHVFQVSESKTETDFQKKIENDKRQKFWCRKSHRRIAKCVLGGAIKILINGFINQLMKKLSKQSNDWLIIKLINQKRGESNLVWLID